MKEKAKPIRITLLGMGMVGKSSLTYRCINYNAPEEHDPTIEDKFLTMLNIDGKSVTTNILDTAGQHGYQKSLLDSWIDQGDGFLLVFAINDKESFNDLDNKKARIDIIKKKSKCPIILVGNKSDLIDRKVSKKEAEEKAKSWGASYIETSAKSDENCKEVFIECAKKILNSQGSGQGNNNSSVEAQDKKCCIIF